MARYLVQGCDVWLNNPLRPLEACGTSGMKAALNGGLNLSVRDGWWDEWYDGGNGWAIPSADGVADPDRRDELEAAALYDLLGEVGGAAVLRCRAPTACRTAGSRWCGTRCARLGPLVRADRMVARLRDQPVRAGRAGVAGAGRGRDRTSRPATSPRGRTGSGGPGAGCGSSTSRPTGPSRRSARCSTSGRRWRWASCPRTTCASRWSTAVRARTTRSSTRRTWPSTPSDSAPGRFSGVGRARPARARSATPAASCPPPAARQAAELGLVTYPEGPAGMSTGDLR